MCFGKINSRAINIWIKNIVLRIMNMCECASKLPKNSILLYKKKLECFYLVIQVRSSDMIYIFGLKGTFVTWDSMLTSSQKSFWLHGVAENFGMLPWIQDLPQSCWFVYVYLFYDLSVLFYTLKCLKSYQMVNRFQPLHCTDFCIQSLQKDEYMQIA